MTTRIDDLVESSVRLGRQRGKVERSGRLMAGSTTKLARQGAGWRPTALSAGVDTTGHADRRAPVANSRMEGDCHGGEVRS
jgi:hypothetical protein